MKTILYCAVLLASMGVCIAQKRVDGTVTFAQNSHDFGKIKQGKPVTFPFSFTNKSSKPIFISQVKTSCGCTTPQYPQTPILPGKSDNVTVGYNAASLGKFHKTIFVQIAGVTELKELVIQGEVVR